MSYLTPDRTKPITARKLGDDFDRAAVLEALTQNAQNAARAAEKPLPRQEYPRSIKDRLQRNKAAINAPKQDSVQRMVDREAKRAEGKGIGYDRWAAVHNLKQMAATMSIYEESGFFSPEELEAALLHRADRKRCTECGGYFLPKSSPLRGAMASTEIIAAQAGYRRDDIVTVLLLVERGFGAARV